MARASIMLVLFFAPFVGTASRQLPQSASSNCVSSAPGSLAYTVTVCLTSPAGGSELTGNATVKATVSILGTSFGVRRVIFACPSASCVGTTSFFGAPAVSLACMTGREITNDAGGVPATFTAALDLDDSTFNRPVSCGSLSGVGTAVAYDTITITNASSGVANFIVFTSMVGGGACAGAPDTFLVVYDTTFNPASPLTGCLAPIDRGGLEQLIANGKAIPMILVMPFGSTGSI